MTNMSEKKVDHCKSRRENNGICPHHNLHCGWPDCEKPPIQISLDAPTANNEKITLAEAWAEGYARGIEDERISQASIGICGYGQKVSPNRNNPYGKFTTFIPEVGTDSNDFVAWDRAFSSIRRSLKSFGISISDDQLALLTSSAMRAANIRPNYNIGDVVPNIMEISPLWEEMRKIYCRGWNDCCEVTLKNIKAMK